MKAKTIVNELKAQGVNDESELKLFSGMLYGMRNVLPITKAMIVNFLDFYNRNDSRFTFGLQRSVTGPEDYEPHAFLNEMLTRYAKNRYILSWMQNRCSLGKIFTVDDGWDNYHATNNKSFFHDMSFIFNPIGDPVIFEAVNAAYLEHHLVKRFDQRISVLAEAQGDTVYDNRCLRHNWYAFAHDVSDVLWESVDTDRYFEIVFDKLMLNKIDTELLDILCGIGTDEAWTLAFNWMYFCLANGKQFRFNGRRFR